ncbi:hypothetical protein MLD38_011313 [Melastoma candidum]|uniref:Uncharacterized protein n=1 Tax=Melastoma candidum TaxID=119954 RepID=A0ACB9R2M6_9MYRT|nr:hypothetical protein MLD38_011313 [Melastoma candidum]
MASLHVLAIPFPAQGHNIPLMELSQCLAVSGFHVTFVNSEVDHRKVLRSLPDSGGAYFGRKDSSCNAGGIGATDRGAERARREDKVSCVIAEFSMSWAFKVAKKMGIQKVAAFWPVSAAFLAVLWSVPKLIEDGVVDENGRTPLKQELIRLEPTMPAMNPRHFYWTCMGNLEAHKTLFGFAESVYKLGEDDVEWILQLLD